MSCLVRKIARQALVTFRNPLSAAPTLDEVNKAFVENHSKLKALMTEVRAADLKIVPGSRVDSLGYLHEPPVTYMHICETDSFSMGVFLLRSGANIPLHDHPGMHGMMKVMYGKLRVTSFDRLDKPSDSEPPYQRGALRRTVLRSVGEFTEDSGTCVLHPDLNNLHRIEAVDGPTAFLDVLAPPYDPDDGRDCHYYKVVDPVGGPDGGPAQRTETQEQKEVWLMEITQPPEFWCGSEAYPGPEVTL